MSTLWNNTTYNINAADMSWLNGLGASSGFVVGSNGFLNSIYGCGFGYGMDESAMWGYMASQIVGTATEITVGAITAHKTQKNVADAEAKATREQLQTKLDEIDSKIEDQEARKNLDVNDANNTAHKYIGDTYDANIKKTTNAYEDNKSNKEGYKKQLEELKKDPEKNKSLIDDIEKKYNECITNEQVLKTAKERAENDKKEAIEEVKAKATEALEKLIKERNEIQAKLKKLEDAKKDADFNKTLNKADGNGLVRLFDGKNSTRDKFHSYRVLLEKFNSMSDGNKKDEIGKELYKLGKQITSEVDVTKAGKTTSNAVSQIESWMNSNSKYKS